MHFQTFFRPLAVSFSILLLTGCSLGSSGTSALPEDVPQGSYLLTMRAPDMYCGGCEWSVENELQIPLSETLKERENFAEEFSRKGKYNLRSLYTKYIDKIGANGLINEVQELRPYCHNEGHDLGKVIYERLGSVGQSLRTCSDACYSGCMHGILMEAFSEGEEHEHDDIPLIHNHVDLSDVSEKIATICRDEESNMNKAGFKIGDCVHGVGHAVMFLSDYDIPKALETCRYLETDKMKYYCSTGTYMEYITNNHLIDSKTKSLFYPCDENEYPAACFRYKLVHVFRKQASGEKGFLEIVRKCEELSGKYRLGCFHGIGNAHMYAIAFGRSTIEDICKYGTDEDKYMCIEGAIERMAKFYPNVVKNVCNQVEGWEKELCLEGAERGMYGLDKDFSYYFLDG